MDEQQVKLVATARALNSGAIHLLRALRDVDRLSGLTPARLSALSVLVFGEVGTRGELARAEGVSGPTMTRIVDGLVTAGLTERRPHPIDRRAVQVVATQRGVRLMHKAAERRVRAIVTALEQMPDAQRTRLMAAAQLLDTAAAAVRSQNAP